MSTMSHMGKKRWVRILSCVCLPTWSCATLNRDAQADIVEAKLAELGERRQISGAATEPLIFTLHLVEPKGDGNCQAIFQRVAMVHTVAGNMGTGIWLYRVGLVAGEPRIVLRAGLGSRRYEVVWESWPNGARRAGSPPARWIEFGE